MGSPALNTGAVVNCSHGGQAQPVAPETRVTVAQQPVTTQAGPYAVAGCALPSNAGGPCVTAAWTTGATRVTVNGAPLLLQSSSATCAPTGTPLLVINTQAQVTAS